MSLVSSISADWREERLYVLHMIEDLKTEQRRQSEATAIERVEIIQKGQRDIQAAHDKIRKLESTRTLLRLKNWLMTLALSASGAIVFELVKALLNGWRP